MTGLGPRSALNAGCFYLKYRALILRKSPWDLHHSTSISKDTFRVKQKQNKILWHTQSSFVFSLWSWKYCMSLFLKNHFLKYEYYQYLNVTFGIGRRRCSSHVPSYYSSAVTALYSLTDSFEYISTIATMMMSNRY